MGQRLGVSKGDPIHGNGSSRPFGITIGLVSLAILAIEFLFDLRSETFLHRLVVGLDLLIFVIYLSIAMKTIYRNRFHLFALFSKEKADFAYLCLVCAFVTVPRLAGALIIARFTIHLLMKTLETRLGARLVSALNLLPSQTLALSFIGIIAVGTVLLTFPAATVDGRGATFLNALFTMTSASCVTGLSVYNVGSDFTIFGQAVILFGIQIGGLGIMVLSAAFAVLVGGNIPSRRQVGLREVLDVSTPEGLKTLIRAVTASTIFVEFIGAICLFTLWSNDISRFSARVWWAIFHSVSAFCNAGVALTSNSLMNFVDDPLVCFVFMFLISTGGIGFFVISDLVSKDVWVVKKPKAIWDRLQIQTKVVLVATIILNGVGMLLFLFFEYNGALRGLSVESKIMASLFQAVSLRSAGFNTVPLEVIAAPSIIFCVVFMFIGAAPGSTGGGIKVTTAAVSMMALRAMLRGRQDVELMGRRVPASIVSRSLSIVLIAGMIVAVFLILLLATQDIDFEHLMFETVSAFGTVGLSLGTTASLDSVGKLLIIFVMYVGRIGPLTLALAVGERRLAKGYQLPKGRIAVG